MSDLAGELRHIIEAERERFAVPGVAVAVVAAGEVVLCEGFGTRDLGHGLPVTDRTLFPIASSTKTFTAALCAALVDDGLLEWHRPVREYLPDFRLPDPVLTDQLTVADMLSHRSGLPRHDLLWYAAAGHLGRDELVRALRHLPVSRPIREAWQYNNMLYTAAGELAGRLAGGGYERAVRERLLDPLGMARTTFTVDQTQADPDHARPYVAAAPGEPLKEVPFASLDLVGPAGNMNSCVAELAPWLLTLLGHGVSGQPPLLSESVLSMLRTPAMPLPDGSLLAVGRPVGYGLGLILEDYRGHRISHHGGNIDGFSSQVGSIVEAGIGIAVLCNRDGSGLRDALPYLIYDRLLGLPPQPHGETQLAKETAIHAGRAQVRDRTAAASAGLAAVRPLDDYAGRYAHPGYGEIAVTATADGLAGSYWSLSGPLQHRHLEVFNLMVDLGGVITPLPMRFSHTFDGDVDAVFIQLEAAVEPIRFTRVPDTSHLTDAVLDGLTGEYRHGPLTATVARRGERTLVARIAEGGYVELTPVRDLVFTAGPARVAFTEDGRLLTPYGEFRREES